MALTKDQVSKIRNKFRREKVLAAIKHEKNKSRHKMRQQRKRQEDENPELREDRLKNATTDTIESKRVYDETIDAQVETDEFDSYFTQGKAPKVFITTNKNARKEAYVFAELLLDIFPNSEFYKRKNQFEIKDIAKICAQRDYTDLIVINEDKKNVNGITFVHLPEGPTFYFSISSLILPEKLAGHGRATDHTPELILNNFTTRLGKTVGRLFQSLFPQRPEFEGRQVVTLHNQRDYIFFRRHRYLFKSEERVGLQELGPQFTLKLRRIQKGIRSDEIAWEHRPDMEKDKRKFYL